jgi:FkbM family methyltransferase
MSGLIGRFKLIYYYIISKERRNRTSLKNLLQHVFANKCEAIAPVFSSIISKDDDYVYYHIKGYADPFIFPISAPYHSFAQVIAEGMQPHNWHYYETPETTVEANDIVVDCGSAEGFFAFKNKNKAKKMYLIEPLPVFCDSLHKNFDAVDNIEILSVGLLDKISNASILINEASPIASKIVEGIDPNGVKVEIVTIDSLFADKGKAISYLKADIEGFEEPMIKGALKTIRMYKPKIAITTYHQGQNAMKLIDLITNEVPEYKYRLKGIESYEGKPVMLHMWI